MNGRQTLHYIPHTNITLFTDNVKELKLVAKANKYCMESQEDEIKRLHQLLQQQKDKNDVRVCVAGLCVCLCFIAGYIWFCRLFLFC